MVFYHPRGIDKISGQIEILEASGRKVVYTIVDLVEIMYHSEMDDIPIFDGSHIRAPVGRREVKAEVLLGSMATVDQVGDPSISLDLTKEEAVLVLKIIKRTRPGNAKTYEQLNGLEQKVLAVIQEHESPGRSRKPLKWV